LIGLEIGPVPSDERQTMMQRGGGEEPVRDGNRLMDAQLAPAEGDRFIDREDARREARSKAVEPRFKMNSLGGIVKVKPPRSPPDFTQRDDTQVEPGVERSGTPGLGNEQSPPWRLQKRFASSPTLRASGTPDPPMIAPKLVPFGLTFRRSA
jgi:hypothetical protein